MSSIQDPKEVIARFKKINKQRLKLAREQVKPSQRDFIDIIPLLFHLNNPMLPGYVSKDTPAGISGYEPSDSDLRKAANYSKNLRYRKLGKRSIMAIYAMGSVGTIAQSTGSDFDLWLCHDPELGSEALERLQQKAEAIEQAAAKLQLEVHFFLINSETFRKGEVLELSSESSGSAQYHMLLDEFYRTSVLLAGYFPAWWLVPPEEDANYIEYIDNLSRKRFVYTRDMIDFGALSDIPPGEIVGASIWQFSKAIDSPYKSMLKLLLIELYVAEYPQMNLLSNRFKADVYAGESSVERLDPYIMMLRQLESYLDSLGDYNRMEIMRRCFYFKLNLPLTGKILKSEQEHAEQITEITKGWGWKPYDLISLDNRSTWKIHKVGQERKILFESLATSYRFLSSFTRQIGTRANISDRDMNILGRKLFAAYERKAGKVDIIAHGMGNNLIEQRLTLHEVEADDGGSIWKLYTGYVEKGNNDSEAPLKQTRTLIDLLAWGYFNSVLDRSSMISIQSPNPSIEKVLISRMVDRLYQTFPDKLVIHHDISNYTRQVKVVQSQYMVNIGIEITDGFDMQRYELEGKQTEPLSYGFKRECLMRKLDLIYSTSWGEAMVLHYYGAEGLAEAACFYLKWYAGAGEEDGRPEVPKFLALGITKGTSIAFRLEELFADISEFFYNRNWQERSRYIVAIETSWYVFQIRDKSPKFDIYEDQELLIHELGKTGLSFSETQFDQYAFRDHPLGHIYKQNKPDIIQFFFLPKGKQVEFFILDERGTLYNQILPYHDEKALINHFSRFFDSIMNRITLLIDESGLNGGPKSLEFYRIEHSFFGHFEFIRRAPDFFTQGRRYFSLQVIVEGDESGKPTFNFYSDDQEFSSLVHGNQIFEATVKYILNQRRQGEDYPIYITDISMAVNVLGRNGVQRIQSALFLQYKRRIEGRLNQVLKKLSTNNV